MTSAPSHHRPPCPAPHAYGQRLCMTQIFAFVAVLTACIGCRPSTDDAAAVERLNQAGMLTMKQNGLVYQIKALGKPITTEYANDIAVLPGLKNIDFGGSELTDEAFATAVGTSNPVSVVLNETAISAEGLKAMSGYRRVEAIFLRNTGVDDDALKALGKLTSLTELDLSGTAISGKGLVHLKRLNNLKRLILDDTAVDDEGLDHLKNLTNLVRLEVRNTEITAEGAKNLSAAIGGLVIER